VQAVACTPNERRHEIREAIGDLDERSRVADLLHEAILTLPCADTGRHNVLLSIIGELSEPSSVDVLQRFAWLSEAEVYGEITSGSAAYDGCDFRPTGMLQARAAEMLAWILKTEREDLLMSIIADHPLQSVRLAAIDAYLFNRDDDSNAATRLRDRTRAEDGWAVGLPRRFRGMDLEDFDRLATEHATHPEAPRHIEEANDVY
jgi:hypothetical protein